MTHRGRKGRTELSVVPVIPAISQRPEPPPDLGPDEAQVWRRLVAAMKPAWANGATQDLIVLYCFYTCVAEVLMRDLRQLSTGDKQYSRLHRRLVDTTRTVNALATRLRLCPSSSRAPIYAVDPAASGPKPWEGA
jgi:hypothetical protein